MAGKKQSGIENTGMDKPGTCLVTTKVIPVFGKQGVYRAVHEVSFADRPGKTEGNTERTLSRVEAGCLAAQNGLNQAIREIQMGRRESASSHKVKLVVGKEVWQALEGKGSNDSRYTKATCEVIRTLLKYFGYREVKTPSFQNSGKQKGA